MRDRLDVVEDQKRAQGGGASVRGHDGLFEAGEFFGFRVPEQVAHNELPLDEGQDIADGRDPASDAGEIALGELDRHVLFFLMDEPSLLVGHLDIELERGIDLVLVLAHGQPARLDDRMEEVQPVRLMDEERGVGGQEVDGMLGRDDLAVLGEGRGPGALDLLLGKASDAGDEEV